MEEFLAAVEALSKQELPTSDFNSSVDKLRQNVLSQNNEYISAVVA